jgi:hypothetical protein
MERTNAMATFGDFETTFVEKLTNEQLGYVLREYIRESNHQNWEGHKKSDLPAFARLLADIKLAAVFME